ncbi:hypothetical protein LguiB_031584 [Lonicera macranthoides]
MNLHGQVQIWGRDRMEPKDEGQRSFMNQNLIATYVSLISKGAFVKKIGK